MHSPIETVDLGDVEQAVRVIVAFALTLEPGLSFAG
jgi:putative aminopeptidase FrvX